MTVEDLIRELETCEPGTEVRLAQQPSWPFEYSIETAVEVTDERYTVYADGWHVMEAGQQEDDPVAGPFETEDEAKAWLCENEREPVVYLYEGTQIGYLPAQARNGW